MLKSTKIQSRKYFNNFWENICEKIRAALNIKGSYDSLNEQNCPSIRNNGNKKLLAYIQHFLENVAFTHIGRNAADWWSVYVQFSKFHLM